MDVHTPVAPYQNSGSSPFVDRLPQYYPNDERAVMRMAVRLPNGVRVDHQFSFPVVNIANCIIHGEGEMYSVEVTHRCASRRLLYEELVRMLPGLLRENDVYWFRTKNPETNVHHTCLFEGAELEMQLVTSHVPECGFCFTRRAFIRERDAFDKRQPSDLSTTSPGGTRGFGTPMHVGWAVREPSDTERLQVNRHGWEIMFVLRPQDGTVTVSRLREELGRVLSITDLRRILLSSGPFIWGPEFQEDGKDYYSTYFVHDHIVESRSMKTPRGSALMYVTEVDV